MPLGATRSTQPVARAPQPAPFNITPPPVFQQPGQVAPPPPINFAGGEGAQSTLNPQLLMALQGLFQGQQGGGLGGISALGASPLASFLAQMQRSRPGGAGTPNQQAAGSQGALGAASGGLGGMFGNMAASLPQFNGIRAQPALNTNAWRNAPPVVSPTTGGFGGFASPFNTAPPATSLTPPVAQPAAQPSGGPSSALDPLGLGPDAVQGGAYWQNAPTPSF